MAVAVAISFDAGILLNGDAKYSAPSRIPIQLDFDQLEPTD
jgi:hypothetical protein